VTTSFAAARKNVRAVEPVLPTGRATGVGVQILPGEAEMDGFYYACLSTP